MKKFFLFLLTIAIYNTIFAQVGIGTTTPNASAQLDITSSNKGLLIPRMSSFNRTFLLNPANGLLVYDTTVNRIYQYQNGTWRFLITNEYWVQSTTRNWVYNSSDSLGIGNSAPTQRLDVNGNIRSRDDILADGRVVAGGTVSGSGLQSSGGLSVSVNGLIGGSFTSNGNLSTNSNLSVAGSSSLAGNVTTTGDIIANNSGATLQLRNGYNVNYGYLQLSGSDVRLGTNSGNSTGTLIVRMNGNDRVVVYPSGDINTEGKITRQAQTGYNDLLPLAYGKVNDAGTITGGSGNFTITNLGDGDFRINCTGLTASSTVIATATFSSYYPEIVVASVYSTVAGAAYISSYWEYGNSKSPSGFHFIIYK